jgi:uncharacterized protein
MIKILFASDLHGSDLVFNKILNNAVFHNVNAVIIGGDISGKSLTPIIEFQENKFKYNYFGENRIISKDQIEDSIKSISNLGSYPIVMSEDQYDEILNNEKKFKNTFIQLIQGRLENWLKLAEEKLKKRSIRFIIMCGNDDDFILDDTIKKSDYAENPDQQSVKINDIMLIGESLTNYTPFNCPRDVEENKIELSLSVKLKKINLQKPFILISHAPPFNSSLDNVTKLDNNLKPVVLNGSPVIIPAGSKVIRNVIEDQSPIMSLHGHIHESAGYTYIGNTLCINAGSSYNSGILQAYIISIDNNSVTGFFPIIN